MENFEQRLDASFVEGHARWIQTFKTRWTMAWISYILALVGSIALVIAWFGFIGTGGMGPAWFLLAGGILLVLFHEFCHARLIFAFQRFLQDGHATLTPGSALVHLYVPFFNMYGIFKVYRSLTSDFNDYGGRYNLEYKKLDLGLATAYCILVLVGSVVSIARLGAIAVYFIMMSNFTKAATELAKQIDESEEPIEHE